jgi:hypothetical protein
LTGLSSEGADKFLEAVQAVPEAIKKVTLHAVFLDWMDRLQAFIAANGEYTDSAKINVREECGFILLVLRCSPLSGIPCDCKIENQLHMNPGSRELNPVDFGNEIPVSEFVGAHFKDCLGESMG